MVNVILIDRGFQRIINSFKQLNNRKIRTGFFSKELAMIALLNEFGHKNRGGGRTPERSFLRSTVKRQQNYYKSFIAENVRSIVAGAISPNSFLDKMGKEHQMDIKNAIADFSDPANAPRTVMKKGFNNPLIHRGKMLAGVKYKVK